jgi:hypothetical protein
MNRRAALAALCGGVVLPASAQDSEQVFSGFPGTEVHFASQEVGQTLLAARDDWMMATSDFQRRAVVGTTRPVGLQEFSQWNGAAARPWSSEQRARWLAALHTIAPAFVALKIPLPSTVYLIATNGQESSGSPYTRGNAVALAGEARLPGYSDPMLMAHELWHVAARHARSTASRLYAEIGFQPMPALRFPREWEAIRIANPDAPTNAHAMQLQVAQRAPWVTPVLVASRTTLRPGESFFSVMEVRLLEVLPASTIDASTAVMDGGEPRWHRLDGPHDYLQRLGGNTGYVIHPEEVIADNIALLATGGPARNPELLARLRAALAASDAGSAKPAPGDPMH